MCTLILNCPEKRNALNERLLVAIRHEMARLSRDDDIRTVVIRGAGEDAFCAGYDIGALTDKEGGEPRVPNGRPASFEAFEGAVQGIIHYPYPVIAMVNGYAFGGGCDLAVSCDIRVGSDDIQMGMTPARIGMIYAPEGLMRFIRTIGLPKTKEMFFTGRTYDAVAAKAMGLLDYRVPKPDLASFTYALAEEIAGNAPLSLKGIKRILNLIVRSERMAESDQQEAEAIVARVIRSHDLKEGRTAFLERRSPCFTGR